MCVSHIHSNDDHITFAGKYGSILEFTNSTVAPLIMAMEGYDIVSVSLVYSLPCT